MKVPESHCRNLETGSSGIECFAQILVVVNRACRGHYSYGRSDLRDDLGTFCRWLRFELAASLFCFALIRMIIFLSNSMALF